MSGVSSEWKAYADDFKICTFYCIDDVESGSPLLQRDLDIISERSASWNLILNPAKCAVMRFGDRMRRSNRAYFLNGQSLQFKDCLKDLGVMVDTQLKFHCHVRSVAQKVGGLISNLLRTTVCRSKDFMVTL